PTRRPVLSPSASHGSFPALDATPPPRYARGRVSGAPILTCPILPSESRTFVCRRAPRKLNVRGPEDLGNRSDYDFPPWRLAGLGFSEAGGCVEVEPLSGAAVGFSGRGSISLFWISVSYSSSPSFSWKKTRVC